MLVNYSQSLEDRRQKYQLARLAGDSALWSQRVRDWPWAHLRRRLISVHHVDIGELQGGE